MVDVFISYSSADREAARALASALDNAGFTVWWDRKLLGGASYGAEIMKAIADASAVVVMWSRNAVASDWVLKEAEAGAKADKLIPIHIDDAPFPDLFTPLHVLSFQDWTGDADAQFRQLSHSIRLKERTATGGATKRKKATRRLTALTVSVAGLLMAGLAASGALSSLTTALGPNAATAALPDGGDRPERVLDRRAIRSALWILTEAGLPSDSAVDALVATGDFQNAIVRLREERTRKLDDLSPKRSKELLHQIGALAFDRDIDAAIEAYEEIVQLGGDDRLARTQLARLYRRRGAVPLAVSELSLALEHPPYSERDRLLVDIEKARILTTDRDASGGIVQDYDQALSVLSRVIGEAEQLGQADIRAWAEIYVTSFEAFQHNATSGSEELPPEMLERHTQMIKDLIPDLLNAERYEYLATAYTQLSALLIEQGRFEEALEIEHEALAINQLLGRDRNLSHSYHNLASIYLDLDDLQAAEKNIRSAINLVRSYNIFEDLGAHQALLAKIYFRKGDRTAACLYLDRAKRSTSARRSMLIAKLDEAETCDA
ncbi:MAG: toll/interleukin-1 receptor domain-containing protein [Pseudomonadota bacterium]